MQPFTLVFALFIAVASHAGAQSNPLQVGVLLPKPGLHLPDSNCAYLPEDGLNLYDKPDGEVIARLNRDLRTRGYANYLLNIFLAPRNRTPELLSSTALAPLAKNCYAIPFVKQQAGHVRLFGTTEPYSYWVSIEELESKQFYLAAFTPGMEVPHTINSENNAGLLIPDVEKLTELPHENYAYLPEGGLTLYAAPNGKAVSKLSRFCPVGKFSDGQLRMFVLPLENENDCRQVTLSHLVHRSDETYVIPFRQNIDGHVLLFDDEKLGPTWACVTDITAKHFNVVGWKDYLIARQLPAFAKGNGLNLRQSPYSDAARIIVVKGDAMQIWLTGYDEGMCEGAWCKVTVKVFQENPCTTSAPESENLQKEYVGWIKLVDDNGQPNVYINTKGC